MIFVDEWEEASLSVDPEYYNYLLFEDYVNAEGVLSIN